MLVAMNDANRLVVAKSTAVRCIEQLASLDSHACLGWLVFLLLVVGRRFFFLLLFCCFNVIACRFFSCDFVLSALRCFNCWCCFRCCCCCFFLRSICFVFDLIQVDIYIRCFVVHDVLLLLDEFFPRRFFFYIRLF